MSLNQLIASYGHQAATAPIEGYMKGLQFGSQMQDAQQARGLKDIQGQQAQIQLGEMQRKTTPQYIQTQIDIAAQDRQIKNENLQQMTQKSIAGVHSLTTNEARQKIIDRGNEVAPVLRIASLGSPADARSVLNNNLPLLNKDLSKEEIANVEHILKNGTDAQVQHFAELAYHATSTGMKEAQKINLAEIKAKGKQKTLKAAKEGSKITGAMIVSSSGMDAGSGLDLGSMSRGLTESNAQYGVTQDDVSTMMISVIHDLKAKQIKNSSSLWDRITRKDPTIPEIKMATQQALDERYAQSRGNSSNTVTSDMSPLPAGLTQSNLDIMMKRSGWSRDEVISDYNKMSGQ